MLKIGIDKYDETLREKWMPIDDEARDGGRYLIGWMELDGQTGIAVAFWHSSRKQWVGDIAYTTSPTWQPTHYALLPAPTWTKSET